MKDTILLVEDEVNDVFLMKRAMKQAGILHLLQVVEDGQEAIDYLKGTGHYADRSQFPLPRLVLLDLKLPHVMGMEVLRWIRQQSDLQTIIVIVFTSSKMRSDIDTAYQLGANSYPVKPSAPDKLVEIARLISEYWLGLNQSPSVPAECLEATAG